VGQTDIGLAPLSLIGTDAAARRAVVAQADAAGLDHLAMIDHASFREGFGVDGLAFANSVLVLSDRLRCATSAYLLPLRHPTLVARQIADLHQLAPGRFTFGVGIGGEDRDEIFSCGVDPATRGRRADESLVVLRALLSGEPVHHDGEFFQLRNVRIKPAPIEVPIVVGGRSDKALERAGKHGDGWLGVWASPRRYGQAVTTVAEHAVAAGRDPGAFRHALCVYCGVHPDPSRARALVASAMEGLYGITFEQFEHWTPSGTPEVIAEFLVPYLEAGCQDVHLYAVGEDIGAEVEAAAEIRRLLVG
jgi:alkanesulfonate monooxygenase SsuD/methylene tetrahydromethanopterin reductase-like flavin-dependent oxidoreductase (luciferase family)